MRALVKTGAGSRRYCCWVVAAGRRRATTAVAPPSTKPPKPEQQPGGLLDRAGPRSEVFNQVERWVVFSDLHVSRKSLEPCLEVLQKVHQEAQARDAGILFLGDWWDKRGDLPVVPLNEVLRELARWTQPLLLLPGNHDQTDMDGQEHSLLPLVTAVSTAHVFTDPTVFRRALWLPYRRKEHLIRAAMLEAGPVDAIFAHADVMTAHMNAAYQAHNGLPPDIFPEAIPVYTGHYHLPHTVAGTSITYVGSPYQVSRSEQGQQKRLMLLDAHWRHVEDIPLDIGRRFFTLTPPSLPFGNLHAAVAAAPWKLAGVPSILNNRSQQEQPSAANQEASVLSLSPLLSDSTAPGASSAAGAAAGEVQGDITDSTDAAGGSVAAQGHLAALWAEGVLRPGDHVKLVLPVSDVTPEAEQLQRQFSERGVQVEVVLEPRTAVARIAAAEQLTMSQLLDQYAEATGMSPESLQRAHDVLRELGSVTMTPPPATHLEFTSLEVAGFGPFLEPTLYPLDGRGVTVISGDNRDDDSSQSNGAGKTSLVSALLWAFRVDDSRNLNMAQVIHEDAKKARVVVRGVLNGSHPFTLERTATAKKSSLSIQVGGEDLTQQEQRLTDAVLRDQFSAALLPKTLFFGQEQLMELILANDRTFKEDWLGAVADTSSWAAAKAKSLEALKATKAAQQRLAAQVELLQQQATAAEVQVEQLGREEAAWAAQRQLRLDAAHRKQEAAVAQLQGHLQQCHSQRQQLQEWHQRAQQELQHLSQQAAEAAAAAASRLADMAASAAPAAVAVEYDQQAAAAQLAAAQDKVLAAEQAANIQRQHVADLQGQLKVLEQQYKKHTKLVPSMDGHKHVAAAGDIVCNTCGQPIDLELHTRTTQGMAAELQQRQTAVAAGQEEAFSADAVLQAARQALRELQQEQERQLAAARQRRDAQMAQLAEEQRQQALAQQALQQQARMLDMQCRGLEQDVAAAAQVLQGALPHTLNQQQQRLAALDLPLDWEGSSDPQSTLQQQQQQQQAAPWAVQAGRQYILQLQGTVSQATSAVDGVLSAAAAAKQEAEAANPATARREDAQARLTAKQAEVQGKEQEQRSVAQQELELKEVDAAFGPQGIPSFVLEGVLGELQAAASTYLSQLASGMSLELTATKPTAAAAKGKGTGNGRPKKAASKGRSKAAAKGATEEATLSEEEEEGEAASPAPAAAVASREEISKVIKVRAGNGELRERAVTQLSGGERKRVALALALGYTQLASSRGRLSSNLLILDEVLEKLDGEGCARVASVLRGLPQRSVLVVGQAHSFVTDAFGTVDVVVKSSGRARVQLNPGGEAALDSLQLQLQGATSSGSISEEDPQGEPVVAAAAPKRRRRKADS